MITRIESFEDYQPEGNVKDPVSNGDLEGDALESIGKKTTQSRANKNGDLMKRGKTGQSGKGGDRENSEKQNSSNLFPEKCAYEKFEDLGQVMKHVVYKPSNISRESLCLNAEEIAQRLLEVIIIRSGLAGAVGEFFRSNFQLWMILFSFLLYQLIRSYPISMEQICYTSIFISILDENPSYESQILTIVLVSISITSLWSNYVTLEPTFELFLFSVFILAGSAFLMMISSTLFGKKKKKKKK